MIHLDHNATTPVHPDVLAAMLPWFTERFANPSSPHPDGVAAREAIETARAAVAGLLGAPAHTVVFTGGGTEASNLAIRGVMARCPGRPLCIGTLEHPATREPALYLERQGHPLAWLPAGPSGAVHADTPLPDGLALVSLMHANNETGVLQPVRAIADRAHALGALVHTDAAQSVGKVPVDVDALGADLLTVAGHKLYGPKGVGALYVREGVELEPLVRGAGHERGLRPGTENVPAIVGLGAACALASRELDARIARDTALVEALWAALQAGIPGIRRTGDGPRLPNTLHVRVPGSGRALLARCPEIAAGTGSACHAGHETPSPVLLAMGIEPTDALGALRLTVGRATSAPDVQRAAQMLVAAYSVS
ncbi:MAG: cysteine desulfurase [Myxococcales bacterium]|nr:cysteine desulfurase [Myxococcales bacterium]MCB9671419.1 cysteine desulfurase [Alphaproteobacteria bacterium]